MENKNTHTLNKIVNEFALYGVNIIQLLESIDAIVTDSKEFVTIKIVNAAGKTITKKLPSIGKIQNDISALQNLLNDLYEIKNNEVYVISEGVKHPVFIPSYPYDLLPPINITNINYVFYNNQFYTRVYANNIEKIIKYKKYILNINDNNFNNIENINDETTLISYLDTNNIKYKIEEKIIRNDPGIIKFSGKFNVLYKAKNIYTIDTLNYTDKDNKSYRLEIGDSLYFNNTEVKIKAINYNNNTITLLTTKGYDVISIGTNLKLLSAFTYNEYFDIPCNIEDKYYLFVKNIDNQFNIETLSQTDAIKINTVELKSIKDKSIIDFNIDEIVNDKVIPRNLGITPNPPKLNTEDFKVTRINDHLFQDSIVISVQQKISRKNELNSEISEIDKALDEKKSLLSEDITIEKTNSIQNDINTLVNKRKVKSNEYVSIINELSAINTDSIKFIKPKYRIRGFFDIPQEITSNITGLQNIVQFIVSYRYKGKNQNTSQNKNYIRTDSDGNKKIGVFSDWTDIYTKQRIKVLDTITNTYIWQEQKTEDGQQVNINQIDIPIQKGEIVEFKIRSISEAGFPIEPLLSDWSNINSIKFPDEITNVNELQDIISNSLADDANILIENVLAAKGLDLHTRNSITRNEQYFAHPSADLSSGIFDAAGNLLSIETVLKGFQNNITEIQKSIQNELPELKVIIVDPLGKEIQINKNSNNNIFTGYYTDDLSNIPETEQNGAIITKTYQLFLYNTSGSSIYLNSIAEGGMETLLDDNDYAEYSRVKSRKYEIVPILINSIDKENFSIQKRGQFIYMRYKNFGFNEDFYTNEGDANEWYIGGSLGDNSESDNTYFMQSDINSDITSPDFLPDKIGAYVYLNIDNRNDIYVGAPDYGSVKELKPGKENGIRIPINFKYRLTDNNGELPSGVENVEFRKKIGIDIFLYQLNTFSFDLEFIIKNNKDTF